MEEMRQQFEQWFSREIVEQPVIFPKFADGEYTEGYDYDFEFYQMLQAMWMTWKASRSALVVELPDYTSDSDDELSCFDGEYEWGNRAGATYAVNQCANIIRAAGITVKGEGDLISTPDHVLDKKWHEHFGKGGGDETNPNDSR